MNLPILYSKSHWSKRKLAREEYVKLQNGNCWYCGNPLSGKPTEKVERARINYQLFPPNMFKHPVHLHHDHNTDYTIGAVHARCNAYLWQYEGE